MSRYALEDRIDELMAEFVSPEGPGAVVLIGRDDRVLMKKPYGLADVETGQPLVADTRFVIGSVTKQFVGMCIMMLKHRGLLQYDDPIGKFFPDLPEWKDRVTIRHLLQHTSGVREYLTAEFWREANARSTPFTQGDIVNRICTFGELDFEPNSQWRYSNSGYVLLGALIDEVAGKSFAKFAEENIFEPLGMKDSFVGESGEFPARMAAGYEYKSKTESKRTPYNSAVVGWADGNIISTVDDLFLWTRALASSNLLPLEVLSQAFVPWNALDPGATRYGFGLMMAERRGVREIHHSGGTQGYNAHVSSFTDEKLSIILLSNAAGIGVTTITGGIAEILLKDKLLPLPSVDLPEEHLTEKIGRFCGQPRGEEVVLEVRDSLENRGLTATLSDGKSDGIIYDLQAVSRDLFLVDKRTNTYVEFVRACDGTIISARIKSGGSVRSLSKEIV